MYIEYQPDIRLSNLVECFWGTDDIMPGNEVQKILPDGCVDIIFSFSGNNAASMLQQGLPYIVGTSTTFFEIFYSYGIIEMIGIRFRPAGITAFTALPINELTDKRIEINLADTIFDKSFYAILPELKTVNQRIAHIQNYLIARLNTIYLPDERISYASDMIIKRNGQISMKEITDTVCLCDRQFQRRFKSVIGIPPKTFSKVIRFRHTRHYLKQYPEKSLEEVALICGYHDHSHLIKDFKALGGDSPKSLIT